MPSILDDLKKMKQLDRDGVADSIEKLYAQIRQVLSDARLIKVPKEYGQVDKVVISGMGGSNLGAGILKAVYGKEIKVPVMITPGYEVPGYVGRSTLYIMSSYSGTTEETLSVYQEVKRRGAKVMCISSNGGGGLEKLMIKDNLPGYIFNPENNPSDSPRLGLGYSVFGMMTLLAKVGLFTIRVRDMERMVADLEIWDHELRPEVKTGRNIAKKLALAVEGRQPVVIGAEFLQGNLRALRNQFCETGKNFASYLVLPELNHYAMEGLGFPASNKNDLAFFFFDSALYHPRVRKRSELTKQVARKNKIKVVEYSLKGGSRIEQAFEMLQLGSWVTFYLAMLNGVNPAPNPWVDWFKKELK